MKGREEAFGFLPSVTSSNPAPLGLSVTQLPWQPEQTGNRGPDQLRFGAVYSNIYCHPENERNTGEAAMLSVVGNVSFNKDPRERGCGERKHLV